jgi:selenide,water dikinase
LAQVLRALHDNFKAQDFPQVLVGLGGHNDAAVYRLNAEQALVATTDFFPPVVDDPYTYGAIAAANSMSDVYAVGGEVLFALNITAFPDDLDYAILARILQGGADKVAEAGGVIVGGHTLTDKEPKYGLAVTGLVHPDRYLTKGGAKPGDVLALTKALGVGLITTALKRGIAEAAHVDAAVQSMLRLNRHAAHLALRFDAHAATDVTGYGILGHALEMAESSGARLRFRMSDLPLLPGTRECVVRGAFPGGLWRNRDHVLPHLTMGESVSEADQMILFGPETSGGLLLALEPERARQLLAQAQSDGQAAWMVGEVVEGEGVEVT